MGLTRPISLENGRWVIAIERFTIGVLVASFAVGTVTHTLHLVDIGWIVFIAALTWMNVYWTALTALDPLAAILLIR